MHVKLKHACVYMYYTGRKPVEHAEKQHTRVLFGASIPFACMQKLVRIVIIECVVYILYGSGAESKSTQR